MRNSSKTWAGALLMSLALVAGASAAEPAAGTAEDGLAGEIRALLETQAAAWSAGDLETFCSVYADDAAFVSPSGLTQGRQAVLERYRKRYPDKSAMGTLTLEILEVRTAHETEAEAPAGPVASASAVGRWTLSYPDREAATGLTLLVFHRHGEGAWRIVQDASM